MPDPPVVLLPGQTVPTPGPSITVAPMKTAGKFEFTLTVVDDAGLVGRGQFVVTVRPG